jgi:hypothetical protein
LPLNSPVAATATPTTPSNVTGRADAAAADDRLTTQDTKTGLAGRVTILALVAFAISVAFMFLRIDLAEPAWTRMVYLHTGVESIAFAAVGWLFGKEVHRAQAKTAEAHAADAENRAKDANRTATAATAEAATHRERGATLAAAIKASSGSQPVPDDGTKGIAGASFTAARSHFDLLTDLANRLYPTA